MSIPIIVLLSVLGIIVYIIIGTTIDKATMAWKRSLESDWQVWCKCPQKNWCLFDSDYPVRFCVSALWPVGIPVWLLIYFLQKTLFNGAGKTIDFIDEIQDKFVRFLLTPRAKKVKQNKEELSFLKT